MFVGMNACVSFLRYSMRSHVRKCMLHRALPSVCTRRKRADQGALWAENLYTHPNDRGPSLGGKSGNVAAPPADGPRSRAPIMGSPVCLPPCYPRHQCWGEWAEVRSPCWPRCHGHGLRAAQHCWMGAWGAWGSRFFLPSMDPILESSPHHPRRLRGPVKPPCQS